MGTAGFQLTMRDRNDVAQVRMIQSTSWLANHYAFRLVIIKNSPARKVAGPLKTRNAIELMSA